MNEDYKFECDPVRHEDCLQFESFDRTYNVNTSHVIIQLDEGLVKPGIEKNNNKFESSNGFQNFPMVCLEAINTEIEKIADMSEYKFIDVGSGKGKVLFNNLIKNAKYKSYLGIEIDPTYYNISLENLQNTNIEITKEINFLNLDVMEYECLAEPTIYFLNRPFSISYYQKWLEKNKHIFLNNKTIIIAANPEKPIEVSDEKEIGLDVVYTNIDEFGFANIFKSKNV
jgi:ribosomal protein L11 methylase PrmA